MKKVVMYTMLIAVLLMLVPACQPSLDDAKAQFCQDLGGFSGALKSDQSLDENSTVDEVKAAQSEVEKTWSQLQKSAEKLGDIQTDEMEASLKDLQKSVQDVSGEATVGEASSMLQQNAKATLDQVVQINTTVCSTGQ